MNTDMWYTGEYVREVEIKNFEQKICRSYDTLYIM